MENMNPTPATGVPASASDVNQPLPMSTESSSNSGKRVWIILAVVAVVVVGVIAALFGGQFFKGSFVTDLATNSAKFSLNWALDTKATAPALTYVFSYDSGKDAITSDHPLDIAGYAKPKVGAKDDKSNWVKFFSRRLNSASSFRVGEKLIMTQPVDISVLPSGTKIEDYNGVVEAQVDGNTVITGVDRTTSSGSSVLTQ